MCLVFLFLINEIQTKSCELSFETKRIIRRHIFAMCNKKNFLKKAKADITFMSTN